MIGVFGGVRLTLELPAALVPHAVASGMAGELPSRESVSAGRCTGWRADQVQKDRSATGSGSGLSAWRAENLAGIVARTLANCKMQNVQIDFA